MSNFDRPPKPARPSWERAKLVAALTALYLGAAEHSQVQAMAEVNRWYGHEKQLALDRVDAWDGKVDEAVLQQWKTELGGLDLVAVDAALVTITGFSEAYIKSRTIWNYRLRGFDGIAGTLRIQKPFSEMQLIDDQQMQTLGKSAGALGEYGKDDGLITIHLDQFRKEAATYEPGILQAAIIHERTHALVADQQRAFTGVIDEPMNDLLARLVQYELHIESIPEGVGYGDLTLAAYLLYSQVDGREFIQSFLQGHPEAMQQLLDDQFGEDVVSIDQIFRHHTETSSVPLLEVLKLFREHDIDVQQLLDQAETEIGSGENYRLYNDKFEQLIGMTYVFPQTLTTRPRMHGIRSTPTPSDSRLRTLGFKTLTSAVYWPIDEQTSYNINDPIPFEIFGISTLDQMRTHIAGQFSNFNWEYWDQALRPTDPTTHRDFVIDYSIREIAPAVATAMSGEPTDLTAVHTALWEATKIGVTEVEAMRTQFERGEAFQVFDEQ